MEIPKTCLTCKHFSGMKHIPYCQRQPIRSIQGMRPVYPWCIDEFNDPRRCGQEGKYYHPVQESLYFSQEQTNEPKDHNEIHHHER